MLGNSGCGKTVASKVIVEEALLSGIPVIAVDPQGDISSMGFQVDNDKWSSVESVVWTPASNAGVPVCLDPLIYSELQNLTPEDQCKAISAMSKSLVELVSPKSKRKDDVEAYLDLCLQWIVGNRVSITRMEDFVSFLEETNPVLEEHVSKVITSSLRADIIKKFHIMLTGSSKLLFSYGRALSIDDLITPCEPGKTRLSVLYLNGLQSEEEKAFFINRLLYKIYNWMLKNPATEPQLLFYMDEVAPYIPPVRITACKRYFDLLLRQGRKYGVCALLSTQNPGDIDYKVLSQVSNWFLGKLITSQDLKKVENAIRSNTSRVDAIITSLPRLQPGYFHCISSSAQKPELIKFRMCYTRHETLCETDIQEIQPPAGLKTAISKQDLFDIPLFSEEKPRRSCYRSKKLPHSFEAQLEQVFEGIKLKVSI